MIEFDYNVSNVETKMQIFISEWIKQETNLFDSFFHFANERKTSWQYGSQLKKMGVKAGVADIFISKTTNCNQYKGTWIELKAPKKKPTNHQNKFLQQMRSEGYYAFYSDNIEQSIAIISKLYNIK